MEILYTDLTSNLAGKEAPVATAYAESLRKATETSKLNLAAEFTTIIHSGEAARNKVALYAMSAMYDQAEDAAKEEAIASKSGNTLSAHLAKMKLSMAKQDVKFLESQLTALAHSMWGESGMGGLVSNQQVMLPLQYLNYMQSTFKYLVPSETATQRTLVKQKQRKVGWVEGDTKEYPFPDALQSSEFLEKVLKADTQKQVIPINTTAYPSSAPVALLDLMGPAVVKKRDKISPTLTIKSVTIAGKKRPLPYGFNTSVDAVKKGDFSIVIKVDATRYQLSGDVDFVNSEINYQATPGIEEFEVECGLYTGTFQRAVRTREYKEQLHISIDGGVAGVFSYNTMEIADKLTMENTDMVVTAAEIMNEIFEAAKDYNGFKYLDSKWDELVSLEAIGALSTDDKISSYTVNLGPDSAKYTGDPGALRNRFVNDGISKLCLQMKTKMRKAFVANCWTNLEISRVIDQNGENVMFKQGDVYGGVSVPTVVRGAIIAGYSVKLVDTEREALDSKLIKMIAQSEDPTVETFKMLQWVTEFKTDNSYRDPQNPNMPCFTILDNFKVYSIFNVMARLTVLNADILMGGPGSPTSIDETP